MRDLFAVTALVAAGATIGLVVAMDLLSTSHRHDGELNWSQQALQDPAADGCPGQYKTETNVNHRPYLTGCWGKKD